MMLTDKLLAAAAAEVNEATLRVLPEPGDCTPEFSPRFERKMRRVLRRGNHPAAYRVMQRAASIVLVLLIGFASILAVSPTVRAGVYGWIKETYETFVRYEFPGQSAGHDRKGEDQTLEKPVKYVMTALPERYTNIMEFEEYGNYIATYADEEGQVLHFSYGSGNTGSIYIEGKGYDVTSFTICGQQADLYMAIDASNSNGIIWGDRNSGTIFSISAYLDRDELIKLAESVRRADGYLLTGLPDGYTMVDAREDSERYISVFINEKEAQMIDFTYGFTDLYLGMDGYDIVPAMVDGKEAELYLSREPDRNNSVIWSDKETRLIFYVSAPMERDELIALAESVEPIG
ncbi:MAG: DUF4367 domain-containing protein [Lachnospiraceae bacterium]|nr:DUF4367 domain-containing protein [Lachnospiraceae bacterium]